MPASGPCLPPPVPSPEFAGPLDLLLDEVRRQKVAIENIAMAPMVARFLEYLKDPGRRDLNLDMEWLHMAATLIDWKSRSLLPRTVTQDPQPDPARDDLIRRLLAHRKDLADELARRQALEDCQFSRGVAPNGSASPEPALDVADETRFVSVWDLLQEARDLARWAQQHREDQHRWRESFDVDKADTSVSEMMDYLRQELVARRGELEALSLLDSQPTPSRRASLFLGMLEMARDQQVELRQEEVFRKIWVRGLAK